MLRGILRVVTAFALAVCVFACAGPPAETMVEVDPLGWIPSDPAEITVDNADTAAFRTISILMSYNDRFKGDRLPVQITVSAPGGESYAEQFVMYASAEPKKYSDLHESVMPYRDSVVFGVAGRYVFSISPLHEVEGVRAVGIKIE